MSDSGVPTVLNIATDDALAGFNAHKHNVVQYVPRRTNAIDVDNPAFTKDGNWHIDGLDLSAIVPAGATGVVLSMIASGGLLANFFLIWPDRTNYVYTRGSVQLGAPGAFDENVVVLPIDSNRLMDYQISATIATVYVNVLGWFI